MIENTYHGHYKQVRDVETLPLVPLHVAAVEIDHFKYFAVLNDRANNLFGIGTSTGTRYYLDKIVWS